MTVDRLGPHALARETGEADPGYAFLAGLPAMTGHLLVVVTPAAARRADLGALLPDLLRDLLTGRPVEAVWLALRGPVVTAALLEAMAAELDVDLLAPDGPIAVLPGSGLYVRPGAGATGWRRFRAGVASGTFGTRFPVPPWEWALPPGPVHVDAAPGGSVATEPVAAGLAVRFAEAPALAPDHPAHRVAVDPRFPQAVLIGALTPESVAAVLSGLPPGTGDRIVLAPGSSVLVEPERIAAVAVRRGRPVTFRPGVRLAAQPSVTVIVDGRETFRPFPTVLRQHPGPGPQDVLDIAPAPAGWRRVGPRTYRPAEPGPGSDVVAEVVPSGLVLRAPSDAGWPDGPFDPAGWTLHVGEPGAPVGPELLAAVDHLLAGLDDGQRGAVQVTLLGPVPVGAAPGPVGLEPRSPESPSPEPLPPGSRPPGSRPAGAFSGASIVTTSAGPVPPDGSAAAGPAAAAPGPAAPGPADRGPSGGPVPGGLPVPAAVGASTSDRSTADRPASGESTVDGSAVGPAAAVPDRESTPAEQARFATAAGERFTEALAVVNAALATWPSLRRSDPDRAKSDLVAVCLYFGRGEVSAARVNEAVRHGRSGTVEAHLPCLVSGIRRLPTHRRPVLRQGTAAAPVGHDRAPGTLLTEPGFLSASADLDVTVPGADLDILIWPSSARRTSDLLAAPQVEEVIFVSGARFKALALRTAPEPSAPAEDPDGPAAPRVAMLMRELAPGEPHRAGAGFDDRDRAVLAKLDRALSQRQQAELRPVTDAEAAARMTTSLVALRAQPGVPRTPVPAGLAAQS